MPSVENRVVRMEFDNAEFERRLQGTLTSLGQLDKALRFEGAAKGFANISDAAKGVNLSSIAAGVEHIASRFTALGAVAFSVIQNITTSALGMVKKLGGDILEPIIGGGKKRALNLEQARFLFEGIGIDVEKAMDSARKAVLGTAYGLDEAAKAAAQFGASGIDAGDEMYKSLRGVAGVAAMTNSSFEEMSDVFTQAAGQGKISGYTLQRISMRGLNAAAALAKQMGKTEAEIRDMASEGKISFKEFAMAMDDAFGSHAQEANKTFTGSLANMRAAFARLGAAVFTPQLQQERDIFNAITPQVDKLKEALMPLIDAWNFLTTLSTQKLVKGIQAIDLTPLKKAMPAITKGFVNIWVAIDRIKGIAKTAFRDIFPASTTSVIIQFSKWFLEFTKHLTIAGKTAQNLRSIFRGLFSILSIGWEIIKEGVKFIGNLVTEILGLSSGGILSGLAKIGDFFTNLQQALVKGGGIKAFFQELTQFIQKPIQYLQDFKDALVGLFTGFDPKVGDGVSKSVGRISDRLDSMRNAFDRLKDIWRPFSNVMHKIIDVLDQVWDVIANWFKELGQKIADTMEEGDFDAVLDALNVTLLGGIAALLTKWVKGGVSLDLSGGVLDRIGGAFDQLTGVLKSMQMQIKAEALIKIATAVGILTASVVVLSLIDSAALTKALTAMAVGFGQLMGAFAILNTMDSGVKSGATFDMVAGGMIALATALVILSGAVAILGNLDWGELARGLVGIAGLLLLMVAVSYPLSKASPRLIVAGVGITALAVGLNILALAMKIFASMSWGELAKGLVAVAAGLVIIGLAMKLMPPTLPLTGLGLVAVAAALSILGGALKIFASMSWGEIGKGLVVMGGGLLLIGAAMNLFPATTPLIGAGLLLVADALVVMGGALMLMGGMSWGDIARGLVAMAGGLLLMAVAANAMSGAILGAVAIGVMAVSLDILANVLIKLSDLSWGDLLHGLVGVAAALAILGLAGLLLEPVIPAMLGLGAALLLIGAGFALVGAGAYGMAKALEAIADSGKAAAAAIPEILKSIGKSMGALGRGIAEGIIEMVMTLAKAMPVLMKILGAFLEHLIDTVIKLIPKVKEAFMEYIDAIVEIIHEKAPEVIEAGFFLLMQFLQGIRDHIGEITTMVADIFINFMNALSEKVPQMIDSVYNFILTVIEAVLVKLQQLPKDMFAVVGRAIMAGMYGGILRKAAEIAQWFGGLGMAVIRWIGNVARTLWNKGTDLIGGLLSGITDKARAVISWFGRVGSSVLSWIGDLGRTLWNKGTSLIGGILGGIQEKWSSVTSWLGNIASKITGAVGDLARALWDAGTKVIGGLWEGMKSKWETVKGWLSKLNPGNWFNDINVAKGHAERNLIPTGRLVMIGLHEGLEQGWSEVTDWLNRLDPSDTVAQNFANSMNAVVSDMAKQLDSMDEFNPTIKPVLDLTQVAADANKIASYISPGPVAVASLTQARRIATDTNAIKAPDDTTTAIAGKGVVFNQTINAPEQLSTADIYKQTRNQITLAKEELSIP